MDMYSDLCRFLFPKLMYKFMKRHDMNNFDHTAYACWLLDFLGLNNLNDAEIVRIYNTVSDNPRLMINNGKYASRSPFRKEMQTNCSFLCRYDALYELGQLLLKKPERILDPEVVDYGFYQDEEFVKTVISEAEDLNQRMISKGSAQAAA